MTIILFCMFQSLSLCTFGQLCGVSSNITSSNSTIEVYEPLQTVNESSNTSVGCDRPWRVGNDCECADSLDGVIYCESSELFLESRFCMAYDERIGEEVVAQCPYTYNPFTDPNISTIGLYIRLPHTSAEIEHSVCDRFNREGYFCRKCKANYSFTMYPDFIKCVECDPSHYLRNWVFYILLSYGPLTVFLILVICLRISATSAPMNTFIFVSQVISQPPFQRGFIHTMSVSYLSTGAQSFLKILHSHYGIWNLDFFTALVTPFCLPIQSVYNVISLTYIIALYPLVLLILVYVLVELYSKNFKLVVWLWRPFNICYARFRRHWDIRASIVDTFATFLLLSYVKFLFVSCDILAPSPVMAKNGSTIAIASYFDARVELSAEPKLVLTVIGVLLLLLVFVFLPAILLLLYPCGFCQKCLTFCRLDFQPLNFLMESFYCSYKNGTDGDRDCRYFASLFLFARIVISMEYAVTVSSASYHSAVSMTCITLAVLIAAVHPYNKRYNTFNHLDPILMLFLVIWIECFKDIHLAAGRHRQVQQSIVPFLYVSLILPTLLVSIYWIRRVFKKKFCCKKSNYLQIHDHLNDDLLEQLSSSPRAPKKLIN